MLFDIIIDTLLIPWLSIRVYFKPSVLGFFSYDNKNIPEINGNYKLRFLMEIQLKEHMFVYVNDIVARITYDPNVMKITSDKHQTVLNVCYYKET